MNVHRSNKRKWFHIRKKKKKSRQYLTETMTDADYRDDLALLTNTLPQAGSLLHSLKQAAKSIGLSMNANRTEYMCFKQKEIIFTLSGKPLK